MKTLDYGGLSVVALKAIQELDALTQQQAKQLASQEAEIERLRALLEGSP